MFALLFFVENYPGAVGPIADFQEVLKGPLKEILTAAIGAAAALLIPWLKAPPITKADPVPTKPTDGTDSRSQVVHTYTTGSPDLDAKMNELQSRLDKWEEYGESMTEYLGQVDAVRHTMDTRQAVLRVTAYAILVLALVISAVGFVAPNYVSPPEAGQSVGALRKDVFLVHYAWSSGAVALTGLLVGAVICKIRQHTTAWQAAECAARAAMILGLGSFLISLPYTFAAMKPLTIAAPGFKGDLPMLAWIALFRVGVFPVVCALFSFGSFQAIKYLSKPWQPVASASHAPPVGAPTSA